MGQTDRWTDTQMDIQLDTSLSYAGIIIVNTCSARRGQRYKCDDMGTETWQAWTDTCRSYKWHLFSWSHKSNLHMWVIGKH